MPRLVNGLEQVFTNLGIVGNGYKLFFYKNGTTTPKNTYSDQSLVTPNPNPVVCDASGRPQYDIWGDDPATYKMILATPDSTLGNITPIKTLDPIDNLNANSITAIDPLPTAYWGLTTGSSSHYTLNSLVDISSYSDKQCFFIDFHTACAASPDIDINGIGVINLKKYTGSGSKVGIIAGDVQIRRHLAIIDGVDCIILDPNVQPLLSGSATSLTIASGAITLTNNSNSYAIDTESSAATDDLDTINSGQNGQVIYLRQVADARDIIITNGVGNIIIPYGSNLSLTATSGWAAFRYDGTNWFLISINLSPTINYSNPTSLSYNTIYQASVNGFLVIKLSGTFRNGAQLEIGTASPPTTILGQWGDDINSNTKEVSACFPIQKDYYYRLAPMSGRDAWETITFTFYPTVYY